MRILSVDNKQNTNFGMVRVVNADTPKLRKKAWRLLIDLMSNTSVYNPFRVTDALNPKYNPRIKPLAEGCRSDGGYYLGDLLDKGQLSKYRKTGGNVFIFDEELQVVKRGGRSMADWFEQAFSHPVEITMQKLTELTERLKEKKEAVLKAKAALEKAKADVGEVQTGISEELGLGLFKI